MPNHPLKIQNPAAKNLNSKVPNQKYKIKSKTLQMQNPNHPSYAIGALGLSSL